MNKVIFIGRLTKDPEIVQAGETTVARFCIAVDRKYKKEGQPSADFPNIKAFGKTAEFIGKYFHKGMKIALVGEFRSENYTDKDGVKHYPTYIIAEAVEFAESKQANTNNNVDANGFMEIPDGIDDELPFN